MSQVFSITELPAFGSKARRTPIRFEWDRFHRNIPFQPWEFPTKVRTKRTDYPGTTSDPTEQVLGANFEPFTLSGRWSDKWNEPGYAVKAWREFEQLVNTANLVQFNFQDVFVVGLITGFVPTYLRRSEIRYAFTVSPHHRRPGDRVSKSPRTVLNATQLLHEVVAIRDTAAELHERAPRFFTSGSIYADIGDELATWDSTITSIEDAISQRIVAPDEEPGTALQRIAALYILLRTTAEAINELLREVRSDTDLGYVSAMNTLDFDVWAKGINYEARRMVVRGENNARELTARALPNSVAIYRPYAGEHLHRISQRFYGTPFNWRRIVTRNHLGNEMTLLGTELLIIPEATSR